jgi:hypothetical protein
MIQQKTTTKLVIKLDKTLPKLSYIIMLTFITHQSKH